MAYGKKPGVMGEPAASANVASPKVQQDGDVVRREVAADDRQVGDVVAVEVGRGNPLRKGGSG
jgi:hypothetical protein